MRAHAMWLDFRSPERQAAHASAVRDLHIQNVCRHDDDGKRNTCVFDATVDGKTYVQSMPMDQSLDAEARAPPECATAAPCTQERMQGAPKPIRDEQPRMPMCKLTSLFPEEGASYLPPYPVGYLVDNQNIKTFHRGLHNNSYTQCDVVRLEKGDWKHRCDGDKPEGHYEECSEHSLRLRGLADDLVTVGTSSAALAFQACRFDAKGDMGETQHGRARLPLGASLQDAQSMKTLREVAVKQGIATEADKVELRNLVCWSTADARRMLTS